MMIAIIEDDREISNILSSFLNDNGYETVTEYDGEKGLDMLAREAPDLLLLDLMLPVKGGGDIIKELRRYSDIPVIVISAKSMLETRLEMLKTGADDYIIKPFDLSEVLVRIEVLIRRINSTRKEDLTNGRLVFNISDNTVSIDGVQLNLTAKEHIILRLLMEHPSKVFTKAELYRFAWNEDYLYEDNTINVHVSNLRSKLKKASPSGFDYIETVWGIGYKLREEHI